MGSLQEFEARAFARTLKQNPNYKPLLEVLIDFKNGKIDTATLVSRASEILHGHRDIIAGFNKFLPENNKLPVPNAVEPTKNFSVDIAKSQPQLSLKRRKEVLNEAVKFVNKVQKISENDEVYTSFLRAVTDFQAHRDIIRMDKEISGLFKENPELHIDFTWFAAADDEGRRNQDVGVSFSTKAAKEVTKLKEVITLEECEDELYESDMLFHRIESTQRATEKLLNEMLLEKGNGEGGFKVEDYYSVLHVRCIKMMYGDYGDEIMEHLQANPRAVGLALLGRLDQKLEEVWELRKDVRKRCKRKMRKYHRDTQRREEHNQH